MRSGARKIVNISCPECAKNVKPTSRFIYGTCDSFMDYFILDCGHVKMEKFEGEFEEPKRNPLEASIGEDRDVTELHALMDQSFTTHLRDFLIGGV